MGNSNEATQAAERLTSDGYADPTLEIGTTAGDVAALLADRERLLKIEAAANELDAADQEHAHCPPGDEHADHRLLAAWAALREALEQT